MCVLLGGVTYAQFLSVFRFCGICSVCVCPEVVLHIPRLCRPKGSVTHAKGVSSMKLCCTCPMCVLHEVVLHMPGM